MPGPCDSCKDTCGSGEKGCGDNCKCGSDCSCCPKTADKAKCSCQAGSKCTCSEGTCACAK